VITYEWGEVPCNAPGCRRIVRVRLEGRSKCLAATWPRLIGSYGENEGLAPEGATPLNPALSRGVWQRRLPLLDDEEPFEEEDNDDVPW